MAEDVRSVYLIRHTTRADGMEPQRPAHGHLLRVLAARWLELAIGAGRRFLLDTGTLSVLSYYYGVPAIERWNAAVVPDGPVVERSACPGGATDPAA